MKIKKLIRVKNLEQCLAPSLCFHLMLLTFVLKETICLFLFYSREKAMAPHSNTLAWQIPWTEEPGRLQSMGSLRVGHDWTTSLSLFTFMHWRRKWQPTPVFLPGESQARWSLVGCCLWGRHRVGHNWSDLAAAASTPDWYIEARWKNQFISLYNRYCRMYANVSDIAIAWADIRSPSFP